MVTIKANLFCWSVIMKRLAVVLLGLLVSGGAWAEVLDEAEVKMRLISELNKCSLFNDYAQNYQESERLKNLIFKNIQQIAPYIQDHAAQRMNLNDESLDIKNLSNSDFEIYQEVNNTSFWVGVIFGSLIGERDSYYRLLYKEFPEVSSQDMAKRLIIDNNCDLLGR